MKLLSVDPANYDDAPIEGIRRILEEYTGHKIPRASKILTDKIEWIRMGTTVAANALLERKGESIALCVTRGFHDLLQIGNQARPKIFDLTVAMPSNLYKEVIEAGERVELVLDGEVDGSGSNSSLSLKGISGELVRVVKPLNEEAFKPLERPQRRRKRRDWRDRRDEIGEIAGRNDEQQGISTVPGQSLAYFLRLENCSGRVGDGYSCQASASICDHVSSKKPLPELLKVPE
ncbi:hypothetical protein Syun_012352 [Stephania yunnanensis]|uniref:Hydantoinase/oxoprolinase N-terminal domain-containing protein n=1 Tax=Stephania yunnanensis TaxID=152371 RepID=A0AAP0K1P6_9MAGN